MKKGDVMTEFQKDFLKVFFQSFENEDIKIFAQNVVSKLPDYWWTVNASSSGKYHPAYVMPPSGGGLFIHSSAVFVFLNYALELEMWKNKFTDRERDLLRLGAMIHDGCKHGKTTEGHTIHEHPLVVGEFLDEFKSANFIPDFEVDYIKEAISSHMGEWCTNKRSEIILPKPQTFAQELMHFADYLASRKNIEVHFDEIKSYEKPTMDTYVFNFGKHNGKSFKTVLEQDPSYLTYLKTSNYNKEPLRTFLEQIDV